MIRFAQSMCRRFATALAVVAALAFVADGALGASHHLSAGPAHVGHFHVHANSHAASDHQLADGEVVADADVAAHQHGSSPTSAPDADANCCACACGAVVLLPSLTAQATPFLLIRDMAFANRRHGDGIVPEGLRRPPRPLSIA